MAHQEVPNHSAEAFGVRTDPLGGDRRDDDARIGHLTSVAAVSTDDAENFRTDCARELERANEMDADILLSIAAADAEYEHGVSGAQARDAEPFGEASLPPLVVDSRRQLADVVGWRVRF